MLRWRWLVPSQDVVEVGGVLAHFNPERTREVLGVRGEGPCAVAPVQHHRPHRISMAVGRSDLTDAQERRLRKALIDTYATRIGPARRRSVVLASPGAGNGGAPARGPSASGGILLECLR